MKIGLALVMVASSVLLSYQVEALQEAPVLLAHRGTYYYYHQYPRMTYPGNYGSDGYFYGNPYYYYYSPGIQYFYGNQRYFGW